MKTRALFTCCVLFPVLFAGVPPLSHGASSQVRDLAAVGVVAPRTVTLSAEHPSATKPVTVIVQNRGGQPEIIPDLAALAKLVSLEVESLGALADGEATLVAPSKFPIVLRPGRKAAVVFTVTFSAANDPARSTRTAKHDDFHCVAAIHADALGDKADTNPGNDITSARVATDVVLAASFASDAPASAASAVQRRAALVDASLPSRVRGARNAVRAVVFQRLTAKPMVVPIKKGKTTSEPIVFTAVYTGASSGLSWGPGDAVQPFVYAGNTFKCQWNTGGDHTVNAYIFDGTPNPPHKSLTIQVVKVTLQNDSGGDPEGMTIGVTTANKDRSRTLKAMVEPAAQAGSVSIRIGGKSAASLHVKGTPAVDTGAGTVTFQVEGVGKIGSKVENDVSIEAVVGGVVAASANVTVVVPVFIEHQINLGRHDRNFLAYQGNGRVSGSSPALRGAPVYPMAWRATFYGFDIKIPVTDRFHHPIDGDHLYKDAPVFEAIPEGTSPINQSIQAGSFYLDPAGFPNRMPNPNPTPINATSAAAAVFKAASPFFPSPYANLPLLSNVEIDTPAFKVLVDGFELQPPIKRKFTIFPLNIVTLDNSP